MPCYLKHTSFLRARGVLGSHWVYQKRSWKKKPAEVVLSWDSLSDSKFLDLDLQLLRKLKKTWESGVGRRRTRNEEQIGRRHRAWVEDLYCKGAVDAPPPSFIHRSPMSLVRSSRRQSLTDFCQLPQTTEQFGNVNLHHLKKQSTSKSGRRARC